MSDPIRVLYVDDSPLDRALVVDSLRREPGAFELVEAEDQASFEARLVEAPPDVVLTDFNILGYRGLDVLAHVRERRPGTPVILLTGTGSEEVAIEAMKQGASDYVIKSPQHVRRLPQTIRGALERRRLATDREVAERRTREAHSLLAQIIDASPLAIVAADLERRITTWNRAAEQLFGWKAAEVLGRPAPNIPADVEAEADRLRVLVAEGHVLQGRKVQVLHKSGSRVTVELSAALVRDDRGSPTGVLTMMTDVTRRQSLEEQLRQAQRLEAVGRLAGGVAHDFNNILVAIMGYSELALRRPGIDEKTRRDLEEIHRGGERAAALTRQLLALSRKQVVEAKVINVGGIVLGVEKMLRRLIGEDIQLEVAAASDLWPVLADAGQVEQVLMNLVVNARDAMPKGGTLRITAENRHLDDAFVAGHVGLAPGDYALIQVRDSGVGMTPELQEHIFEPFFTTKDISKGTGLGLSTVYGIVKQCRGHIEVESRPGEGALFRIYLPRTTGPTSGAVGSATLEARTGTETLLLVEDDEVVRAIARIILESVGYRVLAAAGGPEALSLAADHPSLSMVITDVVMPGMNGRELVDELRKRRPDLPALFMSGYTGDALSNYDLDGQRMALIQKPFTRLDFAQKVRECLDRRG